MEIQDLVNNDYRITIRVTDRTGFGVAEYDLLSYNASQNRFYNYDKEVSEPLKSAIAEALPAAENFIAALKRKHAELNPELRINPKR